MGVYLLLMTLKYGRMIIKGFMSSALMAITGNMDSCYGNINMMTCWIRRPLKSEHNKKLAFFMQLKEASDSLNTDSLMAEIKLCQRMNNVDLCMFNVLTKVLQATSSATYSIKEINE